ncbi:antitoxin family protein [Phormidesmis priestleyi]
MVKAQKLDAVYENGILRPLQDLVGLAEHSRVRIIVETEELPSNSPLAFSGILSNEEAAALQTVISQEFDSLDPHSW